MTTDTDTWTDATRVSGELNDSPTLVAFLDRLGLGSLNGPDATTPLGSNQSVTGTTSTGAEIFVKQLDRQKPDAPQRWARILDFEEFAAASSPPDLRTPRLLGFDEHDLLVAFEWLRSASTGDSLAKDDEFPDDLAYRTGRAIGSLHSAPTDSTPRPLDTSPPMLPPVTFLDAIPLTTYVLSSGAMLDVWRLLQNDTDLRAALTELRRQESGVIPVPAHCDLRLDQLLWHAGRLFVCDWEEFRLADPARDVGSFTGEWLYRAVLGIPEVSAEREQLSHQDILDRGVSELTRLRGKNVAFWTGYQEVVGQVGSDLATRATAFAGWHLIDRMIASAEQQPSLDTMNRVAAGIGRTAVLRPERFAKTIGLEG